MNPMLSSIAKTQFSMLTAEKPQSKQRRNIMGRGGNISVLNPKLRNTGKDIDEESKNLVMGDKAI